MKRLIVNADDFGWTRDVNAGIVEAHRGGILTATTLMAGAPAFDDAVRLARENPSLDVGCHLVLAGLPGYPRSVPELVAALAARRLRPFERLEPQILKILGAGLRPLHLDTHKHTHLLPPVLDAVARLSEEYRIPFVRRPFDFPGHPGPVRAAAHAMRLCERWFRGRTFRSTDHFAGFRVTGAYDAAMLVRILAALPEGVTELMTHPGRCTEELRGTATRLKDSRAEELRALTDPRVKEALAEHGVELAGFRDLIEDGIKRRA